MISLRDYQTGLVHDVREQFRAGCKAPLVVSPTGSGKTVLFAYIAQQMGLRNRRVVILVHRQELLDQTSRTLREFGVAHGLIAAGRTPDPLVHVQVASVQTLVRRLGSILPPDLIIVDEAHHAAAGSWKKVIAAYPNARLLGVTATPERLDGKGLRDVFDALVRGPEVADLIAQGFLAVPRYYTPPSGVDMADAKISGGDYRREDAEAAVDKPRITGDAVEHYRKLCPGKPAVAFCASIKHAEHVAEQFRLSGFRAATLDGTLTDHDRRERVRDLGNGRLHVLSSCEIINEGFDLPIVTAAILLRPTASLGLHLQQIGRVLRPAPGKEHAIILDHVGNVHRHGLAEEMRDWSLDGAKARKAKKKADEPEVKFRQCPSCYSCHAPAPKCPECSHVYEIKHREIEQVAGELVELGDVRHQQCPECSHVHSRFDASCPKCGHVHDPTRARKKEQSKAQTLQDLIELGRRRGYKNPHVWANFVWKSRQNRRAA
jgi:superfamily II DNA or RNA helicase